MELKLDVTTYSKFAHLDDCLEHLHHEDGSPTHTDTNFGCFNNLNLDGPMDIPPPPPSSDYLDYRSSLPIWSKRDEFLSTVRQHLVTAVICEPGSEKSTQLPQYILEQSHAEQVPCKMIFSQPRRLAAYALADKVCKERGETLGSVVGYHMPLESNYGLGVALTYCTNGMLMKTLTNRCPKDFGQITHVFIDDVEEEDLSLLVCLKSVLNCHGKLKIVLLMESRCTVNRLQFFFGEAAKLHVPGRKGNVKRLFLPDILKDISNFQYCYRGIDDHILESGMRIVYRYRNKVDREDDNIDHHLIAHIINVIFSCSKGTILVILPSYEDLIVCSETLLTSITLKPELLQVVTLHENVSIHDYQNALKQSDEKFKVIFAESLVESEGVSYLIDCGMEERKLYDNATRTVSLRNVWITEEKANLRAAKCTTGETPVCFHLYTAERLEPPTKSESDPPLHEMYLQMGHFFLNNISENTLNNTIQDLSRLEAINENRTVTPLGKVLSQFSLEPRLAKMVGFGVVLKCLDPVLTIVACLSYKNVFRPPRRVDLERDALDTVREMGEDQLSDHLLLLRMYQTWQDMKVRHKPLISNDFLDWNVMDIVHDIRTQLLSQLRGIGFVTVGGENRIKKLNENSDNWALVKTALAAGYSGRVLASNQVTKYHKYSAITMTKMLSLGRQVCIMYEKMSDGEVQLGTVIAPITATLLCETVNIRPLQPSRDVEIPDIFSNIIRISWLFKRIIYKRISNPFYKLNKFEEELLKACCDIICNEEKRLFPSNPENVGAPPKSFPNIRPTTTRQRIELIAQRPPSDMISCMISCPIRERKSVFFVIKPPKLEWFTNAIINRTWRFASKTEKRMFPHFQKKCDVKLFITADKLDYFQGLAQLLDTNEGDVTKPCRIVWLSTEQVNFDDIKLLNIRNPYNDHRLAYIAEDGDEVEYWCAQRLSILFSK
ncbi:hypothetical protein RI129_012285 [Pyrocoelia pectoralis]|uniref:Helicase-associated domain-containing protein n=1 Tax=Pyrocoelia pectoralis TaxID=417401 RepID=A0AAN7UST8_9COLE